MSQTNLLQGKPQITNFDLSKKDLKISQKTKVQDCKKELQLH